jgi:hypothetical protein
MEKNKNEYWMCIIGPVKRNELGWGADGPMRAAVRDKFLEVFEKDDDVCSSGWGIDEERYQVLRTLDTKSTEELKRILKYAK